jgi:hypothetical protein
MLADLCANFNTIHSDNDIIPTPQVGREVMGVKKNKDD